MDLSFNISMLTLIELPLELQSKLIQQLDKDEQVAIMLTCKYFMLVGHTALTCEQYSYFMWKINDLVTDEYFAMMKYALYLISMREPNYTEWLYNLPIIACLNKTSIVF